MSEVAARQLGQHPCVDLVQAVAYFSSVCFNNVMGSARVDQRREAGLRTRTRLMDAALDLLAERGEEGVTLRELTDAAGANVAAVSYHFGSLKALFDAAIEDALERYLDAQQAGRERTDPRVHRRGIGRSLRSTDDPRTERGRS